jgi:putative transposase
VTRYIDLHRGRFGVEPICKVLGVSASAYYQRKTGRRSPRAVEDARLLSLIGELYLVNYEAYGSRRIWKALGRAGHQVGRDRVARLMRSAGMQGAKRRGKRWRTTVADLAQQRPDLVERHFQATRLDELWVADFTYLRSWQGPVFLSFVIDVWSRRVVGWQFASHMRTTLVLDALRMALSTRRTGADVELVHHSDRGSQYLSGDYAQTLADHGILASCGRVGSAYDNALADTQTQNTSLRRTQDASTCTLISSSGRSSRTGINVPYWERRLVLEQFAVGATTDSRRRLRRTGLGVRSAAYARQSGGRVAKRLDSPYRPASRDGA